MAKKIAKDIKTLGKHIDNLRIEKGYSMREFAEICGISKSQVNELTNKGIDFRYSSIVKIAKGLGIPVSKLLDIKL